MLPDASGTLATIRNTVTNDVMTLTWSTESRVALARFAPLTNLTGQDGALLSDSLRDWIGPSGAPFALLADCQGVRGTDAEYRSSNTRFFRQHRETAYLALINLHPIIQVVAEMFRIATGIQMKVLADESAARAWLRTKGIAA